MRESLHCFLFLQQFIKSLRPNGQVAAKRSSTEQIAIHFLSAWSQLSCWARLRPAAGDALSVSNQRS